MNARSRSEIEAMDDTGVAQLRIPPSSPEAEKSVLGALLLENAAWDQVGDMLAAEDFYLFAHKLVYGAIGALVYAGRRADVVTVYDHLQKVGKGEEVGGLPYLNSLAQFVPGAANASLYAEIVREKALLRRLIATADEIITTAFNTEGRRVDEILDDAQRKVMECAPDVRQGDWEAMELGIVRFLDRIQDEYEGTSKPDIIPFGLGDIDERLDGGGRPGEVIVIGARPNMGKSAMGLTIAINVAEAGEPTAYWSGEMSKGQLHTRSMSMRSGIHLSRLKRPERLRDYDWPGITKGVEALRPLPIQFSDRTGMTITKLRSQARALKRSHGLRLLVVDHLGLVNPTATKQQRTVSQQIGEITRGLKEMAKELGLVVVLLVQLNREVEKRVDQKPILADLRDSGDIEQDADVVMFLHRAIYYKRDLGDEWKYHATGIIAKLRDGEPGEVPLEFIGENTKFGTWPKDTPVPSSQVRVKKVL
jgi:replicative DNA helicase